MSQKNETSGKVISGARAEEILGIFRTLHGKVLTALQECEIKPLFNDKFGECVPEDYKLLHQQSRALLIAKANKEWNDYTVTIKAKIAEVVESHQVRARAAKEQLDTLRATMPEETRALLPSFPSTVKIPFSDLVGCFPQGKEPGQILVELDKLFPRQVGKGANDTFVLTVAFQPAVKVVKEEPKSEEAPKSAEQPLSAAAE